MNDTTPGPNYGFLIENNDLGNEGIIEFRQGAGVSELSLIGNVCGYIYLKSGAGYTYLVDNNDVQNGIFDESGYNYTTISNNTVHNGMIKDNSGGHGYGIEDEIIENNIITADENSPAFVGEDYKAGMIIQSRSATLRNNTITCTGKVSGIRSSAGAPLNIENNTIILDEVQQPNPDPYSGTIGIFNYSGWGFVTGNKISGGDHGYYSKAGTVEFAYNEIEKSFTGFYSMGAEAVHDCIIKNCKGDGMILDGLKDPVHHNMVKNNTGAGIRITRVPIDLGGGADNSPGKNTLQSNSNFDLYIATVSTQNPTVYARYNIWDHENADQISQLDIRDGNDSTGLVNVDFTPWGSFGINDQSDNFELDVYPNPTGGLFTVRYSPFTVRHSLFDAWKVELVDLFGIVVVKLFDGNFCSGTMEFDVSYLPSGIYFCRISTSDSTVKKKIIKL